MDILPKADEAVISNEKFTKYALDPKNSKGKHLAFQTALGYTLENYISLIDNIRRNIKRFPAIRHPDKGHGIRYSVDMELIGANGKVARVITSWIDDNKTREMRLTSAYVKKRRGDYVDYD